MLKVTVFFWGFNFFYYLFHGWIIVEALISIRRELNDPHGVLNNWDEDSVDPCSWAMITCSSENLVIGLGVPSQSSSGTLSTTIGNLTNLRQVLLQNNNLSGKSHPSLELFQNCRHWIYLTIDFSMQFQGHLDN